jgi:hypothetical protein
VYKQWRDKNFWIDQDSQEFLDEMNTPFPEQPEMTDIFADEEDEDDGDDYGGEEDDDDDDEDYDEEAEVYDLEDIRQMQDEYYRKRELKGQLND